MRVARDWVEGDDELGVEVWQEDQPERYYEDAEHAPLRAAHAVVGHLCAAPEDAVLRGEALLHASFRRYWGSSPLRTPALPAHAIIDERPPQWSRLLPWWRAAAMLQHRSVTLAAAALHCLWMRRKELDLARLAAREEQPDFFYGGWRTKPPPFHLRVVLTQVFGEDTEACPAFERAILDEFTLDHTPTQAEYEARTLDWDQVTGLPYAELMAD